MDLAGEGRSSECGTTNSREKEVVERAGGFLAAMAMAMATKTRSAMLISRGR